MNIGIFARTKEGITPATISIVRSKVTAEGDTAAIFALAISADGKAIGTIEIEGAPIQTPAGGKIINYRYEEELRPQHLLRGRSNHRHGRHHDRLPL